MPIVDSLKLKMTGKIFSPGILKLLHMRFVENGFKLWYNYVNVNSICGYDKDVESVTKVINGGTNSLAERKNYTKWIKELWKYAEHHK